MNGLFPELFHCTQAKDMERLAILARTYFGGDGARKPQWDLDVFFYNLGIQRSTKSLDYPGGMLVKDQKGQVETHFVASSNLGDFEKKYLWAYFLGRFFLEVQPVLHKKGTVEFALKETSSPYKRYIQGSPSASSPTEWEELAEEFAAALFLPKGMLQRAGEKLSSLERIAVVFDTPKALVERRILQVSPEMPVVQIVKAEPGGKMASPDLSNALAKIREIAKKIDSSIS